MTGELRSSLPRVRKQPAQVPAECVPSTGYVPMAPMVPGEPASPAKPLSTPLAPLGQSVQPSLQQPLGGSAATPVVDAFGPEAVSAPLRPMSGSAMQPAQGGQVTPAHGLGAPGSPGVPVHAAMAPAPDTAAVPAVPGATAPPSAPLAGNVPERLSEPMHHHVADTVTATPAHELSPPLQEMGHPATHTLMASETDDAVASSPGCGQGCSCCCQDTEDRLDDTTPGHDPGQSVNPPDASPPYAGNPDADPDSVAGNLYLPDTPEHQQVPDTPGTPQRPETGTGVQPSGSHDSPVQVAVPGTPENRRLVEPPAQSKPDYQSNDPLKPFFKSERPQPMQPRTVQEGLVPGAPSPRKVAAQSVQAPSAAVTPGLSERPVNDVEDPAQSLKPPGHEGGERVPPPIFGAGGQPGSGTGGGKKALGDLKATAGGNLTFDENQYKQLTNTVNDTELSLRKEAAQTPTMALDIDLTLKIGNTVWPPAGHVAGWTKHFGESVAGVNEKMRTTLHVFGAALNLATMVFKDTDNLANMDFTTFVTEFPDLNTGGGQTNPGGYGAFGGGAGGQQ